ncbi:hypothetical protein [Aeromonas veronii]|uniref:hypothetical protein n=1 Tax=Aeromonas veronii TaxID=654 RepID=UPI0011184820|nr:hypothetical protein [Aeromonas veronii]TNI12692.1 hypothetical protein CF106_08285 [Aeromonas veronii]
MEHIEIIHAENPRQFDGDSETITLDVLFSHLPDAIQFTARKDDIEPHGQALYERTVAGEFGEIAILPDIASRDNPWKRHQCLSEARDMSLHWDIMGDNEKADAWREYYRAVYALIFQKSWPMVSKWPSRPKGEGLL